MWIRTIVESRRASWRKGWFRTDLKDREELAGKRETVPGKETVFAGLEVRELMY